MPRNHRHAIAVPAEHQHRFWSRVVRGAKRGCWLWTGRVDDFGYGHFKVKGRNLKAHRVAWVIERGAIPDDVTVDHICRQPSCVNPAHLALVSNKENILRGASPTALNAKKTHCIRGHELAGANIRVYRGRRQCLACEWARRHPHVPK